MSSRNKSESLAHDGLLSIQLNSMSVLLKPISLFWNEI